MVDYYARQAADPDHFTLEMEFPNDPWYSTEVLDAVMRAENVDYRMLKTWNDAKILQMGWVYDMNFAASIKRVKERRYIEKIAAFLPDNDQIRRLTQKIREYLDHRTAPEK